MKSVLFVAAIFSLAAAPAANAGGTVVDLGQVEILPQEIGRFQVLAACAPGAHGGPPSTCRELAGAAPTLVFRVRDQPTGVDDADREALRASATPMTAVLGAPITKAEALAKLGGEICGRRILETDSIDQYGGAWVFTPYMYQENGRWVHRWTVTPKFAGYRVSTEGGRRRITILATTDDVQKERGPVRGLIDRFFPGNPF